MRIKGSFTKPVIKREKSEQGGAGLAVTVQEMAARREKRAQQQRKLIQAHGGCVVCINMNIAGPVKRGGLIDWAFFRTVGALLQLMDNASITVNEAQLIAEKTGVEALIAVDGDAEKIKRLAMLVEQSSPMGRLADIDVIAPDMQKIGRAEPRKCLICGENAAVCARSRAHSVAALRKKTLEILRSELAEHTAALAVRALKTEVHITPKPGLVDEMNSGANADMDLTLFERSAEALRPYFKSVADSMLDEAFFTGDGFDPCLRLDSPDLCARLRAAGLEAERTMLRATGGVNTHRGAIYSLGLLAAGYAFAAASCVFDEKIGWQNALSRRGAAASAQLASALGDGSYPTSNGSLVRKEYGVGGAVQQALSGFSLSALAREKMREYSALPQKNGSKKVDPWAYALLFVMAELDDNNALKRGGAEGAAFVKKRAAELLSGADDPALYERLIAFDRELIERNISCGGAADLIAAALFMELMDEDRRLAFALNCGSQSA